MPVMNGAEFLKVVKKTPRLATIPRVIMTAANDPMIGIKEDVTVPLQAGRLRRADPLLHMYCELVRGARAMSGGARRERAKPSRGQRLGPGRSQAAALAAACALVAGVRRASATPALGAARFVSSSWRPCRRGTAPRSRARPGFPVRRRRCRWTIRTPCRCTSSSRSDSPARCCAPTTWPSSSCATSRSAAAATADSQRASAREPTVLVLGGARRAAQATSRGAGAQGNVRRRRTSTPTPLAIAVDAYPDHDRALPQTLAGRARAAGRLARRGRRRRRTPAHPLVVGYARALEVIAREWRVGEGPAGRLPADAGTAAQRELFAAVRENRYALGADGAPRPAAELLADPGVTATVLYRLAQSKTVGREGRPRRGLRAVREGSRPRGHQPGGGAGAVPQLPGEAAVGLGARGAGGEAARATSPTWSTPTAARCPRSGRRSSASSSSPPTAPP